MKKISYLSHFIDEQTPGYGGVDKFTLTQEKSLTCGDSCNKVSFHMTNHFGTHIDYPNHFFQDGKLSHDYSPADLLFSQVSFQHIVLKAGELLSISHMEKIDIHDDVDFIIVKTDFEKYRSEDTYWKENPGLSPELADFLKKKFPNLKGIGFDFISASSFVHRETGREAHKRFLGEKNGQPLLIVEDMKLAELTRAPQTLIIAPLLVRNVDGIQVTVLAIE